MYCLSVLQPGLVGEEFPHERMIPPPVEAKIIRDHDLVLCSHRHGDHMDPGSLPILAANNPHCRFVVPRAEAQFAVRLGLDEARHHDSRLLMAERFSLIRCAMVGAVIIGFGLPLQAQQDHNNQDESKIPPYTLPPILTMQDGTPVRTAEDWNIRRRPEILKLYEDHVYGHTPSGLPQGFAFQVVEQDRNALGGTAHRKQVEVHLSTRVRGCPTVGGRCISNPDRPNAVPRIGAPLARGRGG